MKDTEQNDEALETEEAAPTLRQILLAMGINPDAIGRVKEPDE